MIDKKFFIGIIAGAFIVVLLQFLINDETDEEVSNTDQMNYLMNEVTKSTSYLADKIESAEEEKSGSALFNTSIEAITAIQQQVILDFETNPMLEDDEINRELITVLYELNSLFSKLYVNNNRYTTEELAYLSEHLGNFRNIFFEINESMESQSEREQAYIRLTEELIRNFNESLD